MVVAKRMIYGVLLGAVAACIAAHPTAAQTLYDQTNLVSNGFVPAATIDPQLQAPWGVAFSSTGPFWVSDNNSNLATLYNSAGVKQGLVVSVSTPTGQVFNTDSTGFNIGIGSPAKFIFAGSNGTISAWNGGTTATVVNTISGASYNGLTQGTVPAQGNTPAATYLYAANTAQGRVDVFDSSFSLVKSISFTDPSLPSGYSPFNVQSLNGHLFVAYTNSTTNSSAVAEFDFNGNFIKQVAIGGTLNQAWGLDIAPSSFGQYSNDLLVGDLGDGKVNVFDPNTNVFLGQLDGANGQPIANVGLWTLVNGNGSSAGNMNSVYFTAEGASGTNGVLGSLTAIPEPGSIAILTVGLISLLFVCRAKFGIDRDI